MRGCADENETIKLEHDYMGFSMLNNTYCDFDKCNFYKIEAPHRNSKNMKSGEISYNTCSHSLLMIIYALLLIN